MVNSEILIAELRCGEQILLQQQPDNAPLDPGHWRLPSLPRTGSGAAAISTPPHPAFCGLSVDLADAIHRLLDTLGLPAGHLLSCVDAGLHQPPPWHPEQRPHRHVRLEMKQAPPAAGSWKPLDQWMADYRDGLLLNPLSLALLQDMPRAWHEWRHEEPVYGLRILPVRSHTLPPATHTNAFLLGDDPKILIDPSPADAIAYDALLCALSEEPAEAIFLTHHHPDHHQQAVRLARTLGLPVWASADTLERIPARFGPDYFAGIQTRTIGDGEVLTRCLGLRVIAHAVPGHDAGQLAPALEDGRWMIVGDLIQGIGTVVISAPEGDMREYFRSLQAVIDRDPAVIVPSHGQAMGGTFRIRQTLLHRQIREQQILELQREGRGIEDMLKVIYKDIDARLWPLARRNIESHLQKLREDGQVPA